KELSVPVSTVHLVNGNTLQNVIVKEVLTDLVIFQNPLNNTRSHVALSSIVSWGAF
ncbi:protein CgeC, partial [Bacillus sp. S10C12M]|nr:protein CgeC [Bacillus sp. S10C12M]